MNVILILALCSITMKALGSGGQFCTDSVDIQQDGTNEVEYNRIAIIPHLNFTCNGRITIIRARVERYNVTSRPSFYQVWRPASVGSMIYNKIGEVQLSDDQVTGNGTYQTVNIPLTGDNTIEVQSGDAVGYYRRGGARYRLRTIQADEYILYEFNSESNAPTSVNLNNANHTINEQPLIEFTIDVRCDDLTTPANGEITSCSSGRVGVGYEGDTCSFTCNTGYELTGSNTRTCQSDGSWSGSDDVCSRATSTTTATAAETSAVLIPVSSSAILPNVPISNNSGSSSDSVAIIGGAVGGVILLLMIIVVLCIVVQCVRRSHRKKEFKDDKVTYSTSKLNTDITMDHNSPYDVTKASTVDCTYDDTVNPNVRITTNPSYNVHTRPYSKTSEDDYNYIQPNELMQHSDVDEYVNMHPNIDQSHDLRRIHSHPTANAPVQDECGVVNQPYN